MADLDFMQKTAAYIAKVQPENDRLAKEVASLKAELAKTASAKDSFVKRATQIAGVLANRGLLDKTDIDQFVDKVAEDHSNVWDLVEKLASTIGADSLGEGSKDKLDTAATGDPWYDTFFRKGSGNSSIY